MLAQHSQQAFGITPLYVLALCSANGIVSLGVTMQTATAVAMVARHCRGNEGGDVKSVSREIESTSAVL